MIIKSVFVYAILLLYPNPALNFELPALQSILDNVGNFFRQTNSTKTNDVQNNLKLGPSKGQTHYNFIDYVGYREFNICLPEDRFILHMQRSLNDAQKPPIMVKCLINEYSNSTASSELRLMTSVKDIVALLQPIGNATKRNEPGSCVIIVFFTYSCVGCAHIASYANSLPRYFPNLTFAAIDAFQFPSFNTEFGIVGLPTMLLFHQGRPIVKFYSEARTFTTFVTRHTGIKPIVPLPVNLGGPLPPVGPLPTEPTRGGDGVLLLAWTFILLCLGNYFSKSRLCKQMIEMIKRNWRESEAQLEQQQQH